MDQNQEAQVPVTEKPVVSEILDKEKRDWISVDDKLPDAEECVVIRMCIPDTIFKQYSDVVIPFEDVALGKCLMDYHDESVRTWIVCSPYARVEKSPLAKRGQLINGAIVTHWAYPEEGEVDGWLHRLDPVGTYEHFVIQIDDDHLDDYYTMALFQREFQYTRWQHSKKANSPNADQDYRLYMLACDTIAALDRGYGIGTEDEDPEKKRLQELHDHYENDGNDESEDDPPFIEFPVNKTERESGTNAVEG